jgi:dolichol-phosphate mannosyltransferase
VGIWYVVQKLLGIGLTPGLSTTVLVVTFFSGVQLLALGLIGEYIGRIYDEAKRRPMYIIDRKANLGEQERPHASTALHESTHLKS